MRLRNTERKNYDEKGLENLIWYQARVKKYANGLHAGKPKVKRSKKKSALKSFLETKTLFETDGPSLSECKRQAMSKMLLYVFRC